MNHLLRIWILVSCPVAPSIPNGRLSYDEPSGLYSLGGGYYVGTKATYRCNSGYSLHGDASLWCRNSSKWDPQTPPRCQGNAIIGVFPKLPLSKFRSSKLAKLAKNFDHWPQNWWELNPGPRIISLMVYQIGHWTFCTTCVLNNHQFHVLPCMTGFVKLS